MGTSIEQIDRTYGHLLPDSIDRARAALDAFVSGACPRRRLEWPLERRKPRLSGAF
jgi:hypothetical protein